MTEILFVERAPEAGAEHRLEDGATIGREGCDVELADPDVSRRHAIVHLAGPAIAVEDLGSTNGTFVNDARIGEVTTLRAGDSVRFGDVVWELRIQSQPTRAAQIVQPGAARTGAARGDVPMPDFAPSKVSRVVAPSGGTPAFSPSGGRFKRSAARRLEATVIS